MHRSAAEKACSMENQRIVPAGDIIAPEHPLAALERQLMEKERQRNTAQGRLSRLECILSIAKSMLDDPDYEFTVGDSEFEVHIHEKIRALQLNSSRFLALLVKVLDEENSLPEVLISEIKSAIY
jgi:hypothetical protein